MFFPSSLGHLEASLSKKYTGLLALSVSIQKQQIKDLLKLNVHWKMVVNTMYNYYYDVSVHRE